MMFVGEQNASSCFIYCVFYVFYLWIPDLAMCGLEGHVRARYLALVAHDFLRKLITFFRGVEGRRPRFLIERAAPFNFVRFDLYVVVGLSFRTSNVELR